MSGEGEGKGGAGGYRVIGRGGEPGIKELREEVPVTVTGQ